jgi:hypothetical protein
MHSIDILAPEGANGAAKNTADIDISKVSEALIKELTEAVKANIKKVEEKDCANEANNEASNEASNEANADGNADNTNNEEV